MSKLFDSCRDKLSRELGRAPTLRELTAEVTSVLDRPGDFDMTNFIPPGPVGQAFLMSDDIAPFIMGPVGGGKTALCVMKRILAATKMPAAADGWRRCYWVVLRDTYRSLAKTTLSSWLEWFPKGYPGSSWEGGNDRPAIHTLRFQLPDGSKVEAVTHFMGLNGEKVDARLRGVQISGAWLNEADGIPQNALSYLQSQRIGRYPKLDTLPDGARRHKQVIGDFNAPDIDNWIYEAYVENPTPGRRLYRQPSGTSDMAENLANLDPDYYDKIVEAEEDWYVRRFVHNQFGYSRHGLPVFHDVFDPSVHVANKKLVFDPALPVIIGADGGLAPASILMQPHPNGQLRRLREIVPGHGIDAFTHGQLIAEQLGIECPAAKDVRAYIDPASSYGGGAALGTELEMISQGCGIPFQIPGDGNNSPQRRLGEMRKEFNGRIDAETPRALYCPSMKVTIRGLASGYRFRKRPEGASTKYEPIPEKNEYSHPCDADQYGTIGYRSAPGYFNSASRGWASQRGTMPGSARRSASRSPWSPHRIGL